jgi:hypothetical protein
LRARRSRLRIPELRTQYLGDTLGEEGAAEERTTDGIQSIGAERVGEGRDERPNAVRCREERIEVEPQRAVIAGLHPEMAPAARRELYECRDGEVGHE